MNYDKGNSLCQIDLCHFCVVGNLPKTLLQWWIQISQMGSVNQPFGLIFPKNCIKRKKLDRGECIFEQGSIEYASESFLQFHQCGKYDRHANTLLISKIRVSGWQGLLGSTASHLCFN